MLEYRWQQAVTKATRHVGRLTLGCACVVFLLTSCAHTTTIPTSEAGWKAPVASLTEEAKNLASTLDQLRAENARRDNALNRQLADLAAQQMALDARLSALIAEAANGSNREKRTLLLAFTTLGDRISDQARQIEQLRRDLDKAPAGDDSGSIRLEAALRDLSRQLNETLNGISAALSHEKSLWSQIEPSLIGTLVGAVLGLFGSWVVARWNYRRTQEQKRVDLMVDLLDQYGSEVVQNRYAKTRGYLEPRGQAALDDPVYRNEIVRMWGFFKQIQLLHARNFLDTDLLKKSQLIEYGNQFRGKIEAVDDTAHPEFARMVKANL